MSASEWTDDEADIQRECWSHGYLLTNEELRAEVNARREVEPVQDAASASS